MRYHPGNRVKVANNTRVHHYAPIGTTGVVEAEVLPRNEKGRRYRVKFDYPVKHVETGVELITQVFAEEDLVPDRTIEEMQQEFLELLRRGVTPQSPEDANPSPEPLRVGNGTHVMRKVKYGFAANDGKPVAMVGLQVVRDADNLSKFALSCLEAAAWMKENS